MHRSPIFPYGCTLPYPRATANGRLRLWTCGYSSMWACHTCGFLKPPPQSRHRTTVMTKITLVLTLHPRTIQNTVCISVPVGTLVLALPCPPPHHHPWLLATVSTFSVSILPAFQECCINRIIPYVKLLTFNVIIAMLELKSAISFSVYYLFPLFFISVFFCLPSQGLLEHLSVVFFIVSLSLSQKEREREEERESTCQWGLRGGEEGERDCHADSMPSEEPNMGSIS